MSAGSINASNESPANSASSTRVSSPGSYVAFPDPQFLSQPIPIPVNQNNSTAGVPRQLSVGHTPSPRAPDVPIELNIPLGRLSPQSVRNAIAISNGPTRTLRHYRHPCRNFEQPPSAISPPSSRQSRGT